MSLAHAAAGASTQPTQVLQSYLALHTEVVSVLQAKVAPRLSHSGVLPVCLFLETAVGVDLNWLMVLSTIVSSRLAMGIGPFRVWDFIGILGGELFDCVAEACCCLSIRGSAWDACGHVQGSHQRNLPLCIGACCFLWALGCEALGGLSFGTVGFLCFPCLFQCQAMRPMALPFKVWSPL